MMFFAQMKAVVRQEYDDRVVREAMFVEMVEQLDQAAVSPVWMRDRGIDDELARAAPASPAGTFSGVHARFFQLSMIPASIGAGQRLSSLLLATNSCFKREKIIGIGWSSTGGICQGNAVIENGGKQWR